MKKFLATVCIIILIVGLLLRFQFHYSWTLIFYHFLSMTILVSVVVILVRVVRHYVRGIKWKLIIINGICLLVWIGLWIFYLSILTSNYFWGNTITYDIFRNYMVSMDAMLGILPIEKWIVTSAFILIFVLILTSFIFIRVKAAYVAQPASSGTRTRKISIAVLVGLVLCTVFRAELLDLKRTMHFKQEPLLYFVLGPMWAVHTDELFDSEHKRTPQDQVCIDNIQKKSPQDRAVVIILLDALRSDHLPSYGYTRNTTPFIDSLLSVGKLKRVKNSFSTSTNTIGGISGLFYSKSWTNFNYSQLNLMQYFKKSGFKTYAFLTGYHSGWYGLSAMYREHCDNFYESTSDYNVATDDDLITLDKINSTTLTTGSFIFIHLLSTHTIGMKNEAFKKFKPDKIGFNGDQSQALVNNYDNGVLQGDYIIRGVFQKLREDSILEKSTIFIVSDHGDLMGDDGLYGHSGGIHEKLLEVPMFIYDQDSAWYQRLNFASLADIAPTLSDRVFSESPPCWEGKSLNKEALAPFTVAVSASTAKTEFSDGVLSQSGDSIVLKIFNPKKELKKVAWRHTNGGAWNTSFPAEVK